MFELERRFDGQYDREASTTTRKDGADSLLSLKDIKWFLRVEKCGQDVTEVCEKIANTPHITDMNLFYYNTSAFTEDILLEHVLILFQSSSIESIHFGSSQLIKETPIINMLNVFDALCGNDKINLISMNHVLVNPVTLQEALDKFQLHTNVLAIHIDSNSYYLNKIPLNEREIPLKSRTKSAMKR